jgi:hypothetical protein
VLAAGVVLQLACSSGEPTDEGIPYSVAAASGPDAEAVSTSSDVPVEALSSLETVYVPLKASSLQSLDNALADKGYGNVTASDFQPQFETVTTEFGAAVIAYSSSDWIASNSMFQPMSLTQWLDAALAEDASEGVIINPGHAGQTLALTKTEIVQALRWVPRRDPLPMEIHIAR